MLQAAPVHDTTWDFFSLLPEATHMVMWVLSDRAIPRSFRMLEGFGIHTFRFVKFHWKPVLGMHSLVWDEAQKPAGKDSDWLRRDLWEAIERGIILNMNSACRLSRKRMSLHLRLICWCNQNHTRRTGSGAAHWQDDAQSQSRQFLR